MPRPKSPPLHEWITAVVLILVSFGAQGQSGARRQPEGFGAGPATRPVRPAPPMKVAYVIVASEAPATRLKIAMVELRKAIDRKLMFQTFNVILAHERPVACFDKLAYAEPGNKRKAFEFTDTVKAKGKGALTPALKLAVAQGATEMYVMTLSAVPDMKEATQYLRTVNHGGGGFKAVHELKVKVHTIAFTDAGKEPDAALRKLADENGGTFRSVREDDFVQSGPEK